MVTDPMGHYQWYDRKFVHFVSTMHCATLNNDLPTVMRKNKDGSPETIRCPPLLKHYQQYMKAVDQGDQMIGYLDKDQGNGGNVALLVWQSVHC